MLLGINTLSQHSCASVHPFNILDQHIGLEPILCQQKKQCVHSNSWLATETSTGCLGNFTYIYTHIYIYSCMWLIWRCYAWNIAWTTCKFFCVCVQPFLLSISFMISPDEPSSLAPCSYQCWRSIRVQIANELPPQVAIPKWPWGKQQVILCHIMFGLQTASHLSCMVLG